MARMAGMKLRCRDGHWEFAAWELVPLAFGCGVVTRCQYGDHWLAQDQGLGGEVVSTTQQYLWPSIADAEAALTRWEQQEAGSE